MLLMVAGLTFVSVMLLTFGIYYLTMMNKRNISQRIGTYVKQRPMSIGPSEIRYLQKASARQKGGRGLLRVFSKYFETFQWSRLMEHKLVQAGLLIKGSEFMVVCCGAALAGFLLMLLITGGKFAAVLFGAAAGLLMPFAILNLKIARRTKAFNSQLGDVLILVANSLRTGYSFMQALDMVANEMPPPISTEFARVLKEMNLGVTTEEALNNLAKRVDSDDLDLVITAVLIQRQVGGNLAEVLNNIAGTIRERIKIKGEIKTLTAQGRISGIIIGLLPIALGAMIYVINPQYITILFTHKAGKMMLGGAVVSQLLGVVMIRKIIDIEI